MSVTELPVKKEVPSWRLIVTLALAGGLAALALSVVNEVTLPAIMANRAKVLKEAVGVVLKDPVRVVSLKVDGARLVEDEEVVYREEKGVTRVYFGWDADDAPLGFAVVGGAMGYGSDPIRLVFGYDAKTDEIIGLKILSHKETPGIGTKIEEEGTPFVDVWWRPPAEGAHPRGRTEARLVPIKAVRADAEPNKDDRHEVDMISGATISSKAIIKVVNEAIASHGDKMKAWREAQ